MRVVMDPYRRPLRAALVSDDGWRGLLLDILVCRGRVIGKPTACYQAPDVPHHDAVCMLSEVGNG